MDAAAERGWNPVSKHQIQPEYGDEQADAGRDCQTRLARPNFQARPGRGKYLFSLFIGPRAGLATLTRLIYTLLLYVMTIQKIVHTSYSTWYTLLSLDWSTVLRT